MKLLILAALAALPFAAVAADQTPDSHFYKALAEGGIAEVRDGKLAESKSSNQQVKDFGAMMVKDHTDANQQLMALAQTKGLKLPKGPGIGADTKKGELDILTGETFDKSYIKSQVKAHEDTIALLQKEIASGQDADAKALAQKLLPTVQAHLKAAQTIASSLGITG